MSEDVCSVEAIGRFLEDGTTREILLAANQTPQSAESLSKATGASKPTVYRRLDDLRECNLLVERLRPDPDGGHHHRVYTTDLARIIIELEDHGFDVEVTRREGMADRFTRLVEEM